MLKLFVATLSAMAHSNYNLIDAENFFAAGKLEESKAIYEVYISSNDVSNTDLAYAQCRLGIVHSIQSNFKKSLTYLEQSLSSNVLTNDKSDVCKYALLQVYVVTKNYDQALELYNNLKNLNSMSLGTPYKERIHGLGLVIAQFKKDRQLEINTLESLKSLMANSDMSKVDISILNKSFSANYINERLAEIKSAQKVEKVLITSPIPNDSILVESWINPEWKNHLDLFLKANTSAKNILKIGVILPSHQSLTKFNVKILKGISSFLSSDIKSVKDIEIFVGSAKSDLGSLEMEAIKLITENKINILIGPFTGTHAAALASVSNFFNVPVVSLGAVANTSEISSSSFLRMGMLARSQSIALTQTLKENFKKFNSISILSPNDSFGFEMANEFESACKDKGLTVVRKDWFDTNQSSYHETVQKIVNTSKSNSLPSDYRLLIKEAKQKAHEEKRKFDPKKIKIPTYLNFQAVFMPESLPKVRLMSTTFAFYDVRKLLFLGDKQWLEGSGNTTFADDFLHGAPVSSLVPGPYFKFIYEDLDSSSKSSSLDLERQSFDALVYVTTGFKKATELDKNIIEIVKKPDFRAEGTANYGPLDDTNSPWANFQTLSFDKGRFTSEFIQPKWYE